MIRKVSLLVAAVMIMAACTSSMMTAPVPTNPPVTVTLAPARTSILPEPSVRVVIHAPDQAIRMVDTGVPLDPLNPPTAGGVIPIGGASNGTIYALNRGYSAHAIAIDGRETRILAFVLDGNSLAVWPGEPTQLSWGISGPNTVLWMSNADGTRRRALLTEDTGGVPYEIVAQGWSRDGQSLYFSKEPNGIGGYIPFLGASSWYQIKVDKREVSELIPLKMSGSPLLCIDDLSSDERLIAEHCGEKAITILDLTTGQSTQIQPPSDNVGFKALGSVRFNANATRVTYALAKHDPDNEQGGIAVSAGLSGSSQLIALSQPGEYFLVAGWLNNNTLLIQLNQFQCTPICPTSLWTVNLDDGQLTKVADGTFVAILN